MKIIAARTLVCRSLAKIHDGRRKHIHLHHSTLKSQARRIKRTCRICPVQMADQPLLTEEQLLPADAQRDSGGFSSTKLNVGRSEIHGVFKRRSVRLCVPPESLRILCLELKPHPVNRGDAHVEP